MFCNFKQAFLQSAMYANFKKTEMKISLTDMESEDGCSKGN